MNSLLLPLDVVRFEIRRSMTAGRLAIWWVLVVFPIAIMATVRITAQANMGERYDPDRLTEPFGMALYFLVPELTCLLGLLLWATPAISTEIEGQTWVYVTLRTLGRPMVLIGKFLTAILWTFSAALISITLCSLILTPVNPFQFWSVMVFLAFLSCVSHAALFVAIGTVCYRRTMVAAVLYTLVVEYGVSFIPAVINKVTINYRLRGLLYDWMEWEAAQNVSIDVFGYETASTHVLSLLIATLLFLGISIYRVQHTEYPTQQEGN